MLLIFSLSITPKKYFHDLIADHTDSYNVNFSGKATVGKTGYSCDCEDLVVSTPFIEPGIGSVCLPQPVFCMHIASPYFFQFLSAHTAKESRGPPSLA